MSVATMTEAEALAERYFALKSIRDSAAPRSQRNRDARRKMLKVITKAQKHGVGGEFLALLEQVCRTPTKVAYADRDAAMEYAWSRMSHLRTIGDSTRTLQPYLCPCGYWHLTSNRTATKEGSSDE